MNKIRLRPAQTLFYDFAARYGAFSISFDFLVFSPGMRFIQIFLRHLYFVRLAFALRGTHQKEFWLGKLPYLLG